MNSNNETNNMFKEVFEEDFTYIAGFMRSVRRFADKNAMTDPLADKTWTYRELNAEVNKLSNALLEKGVKKGDVVLCQLYNCPEYVFSYVAPQKIGAVTSPVNYNFSAYESAVCLEKSKPKVFIYDYKIKDSTLIALEKSSFKPDYVVIAGGDEVPEGHISYEDFVKDSKDTEPVVDFKPNIYDEVQRLYTSGTTGNPKGVPIYNANEVMTCHDVLMHFPLNSTDVTMNTTPWFHRGGIHSGGPAPTFYAGGSLIIMREFQAVLTLKYIQKYKITFLIGVPSIIKMLVRAQKRFKGDLSSLKGVVTMGAPFERAESISVQEVLTPNIYNGYGTTETFWNTFLRPYDLPEMSGTAGRACTDDDVRVVKLDDTRKVSPCELASMDETEVGEVIIRTTKSSYRYLDNPEEEANKFYKGWVYTGDLATWDKNQYITIVGRKDDMMISGGENIYPPIIEETLNLYPKVKECAVTGIPDALRGEAVVAYIVAEDKSLTVSELVEYCNTDGLLSVFKRPRYYRFVNELPMTATGKIQHNVLKEMALTDQEQGYLKLAMIDRG